MGAKKKKKILVTDDSLTYLMYITVLLKKMGLNVTPAENGLDAIKLINILRPDLIMLDVNMPVVDGVEALKRLKENKETTQIPIVMVSSEADKETIKKCRELGCYEYLPKPFNMDSLLETLQGTLVENAATAKKFRWIPYNRTVTVTHKQSTSKLPGVTLSPNGIYIKSDDPLPSGTEVKLILPLADRRQVTLGGVVIYSFTIKEDSQRIPTGMSVRFTDLTKEKSAALLGHIKAFSKAGKATAKKKKTGGGSFGIKKKAGARKREKPAK